jgi:choline kinase
MYQPWNNFWSLAVAEPAVRRPRLPAVRRRRHPRRQDAAAPAGGARRRAPRGRLRDELDDETMKAQVDGAGAVTGLSKQLAPAACVGEYIGISRLSAAAPPWCSPSCAPCATRARPASTTSTRTPPVRRGAVRFGIVDVHDCTVIEIDNVEDLARAEALVAAREPSRYLSS